VDRKQKTWLVTGCSSGLGKAIAEDVLAFGDRVVVTARSHESARRIAAASPANALPLVLDVADPASVNATVSAAEEWSGDRRARQQRRLWPLRCCRGGE
jgi:NAD(P)-dependent dehydrogenase (short-subunit alcohol dehydrogenase family)